MLHLPAHIMVRLPARIMVRLPAHIRDIPDRLLVLITERLPAHRLPAPITDRLPTNMTVRRPVVDSVLIRQTPIPASRLVGR
jgi:hypothetical protein